MRVEILAIILLSTAGTYMARVIPFFITILERLPVYFKRFLQVMPVAALGALIFPGLLTDFSHAPAAGIIGVLAASVAAVFFRSLIIPVIISIIAAYLMML